MDPITIVTLVGTILGVTVNCAKAAVGVHGLLHSYQDAPQLLTAVSNDCSLIGLTLSRLQMLTQQDDEYASIRFQDQSVLTILNDACVGCNATLIELEHKAAQVSKGGDTSESMRVWNRVRLLWHESDIETLSDRLRYYQISMGTLLQVFQTESIVRVESITIAIQDTLSRHAIVLEQMAILLRGGRRIPSPDTGNLAQLDSALTESASDAISSGTGTLSGSASSRARRKPGQDSPADLNGSEDRTIVDSDNNGAGDWSSFMAGESAMPIFQRYSDALFDFITETWPRDGTIGYEQMRQFAAYSGQKTVYPTDRWIEPYATVLQGQVFSTRPLKALFDDAKIEYEARRVTRTQRIYLPASSESTWYGAKQLTEGSYQTKTYTDASPVLRKPGWLQWLVYTLRYAPGNWYEDHQCVLNTLPRRYRQSLPLGYIHREMLPIGPETQLVNQRDLLAINTIPSDGMFYWMMMARDI